MASEYPLAIAYHVGYQIGFMVGSRRTDLLGEHAACEERPMFRPDPNCTNST